MEEYNVTEVVSTVEGSERVPCWRVISETASGVRHEHLMPQQIVAWRVAEYGIDPEDSETLWDLILHERFMGPLLETEGDPAEAAGLTIKATPAMRAMIADLPAAEKVPVMPHLTGDTALALKAHKLRVAKIKEKFGKVNMPKKKGTARTAAHPMDALLSYRPTTRDLVNCRDKMRTMRAELGVEAQE